MTLCTHIKLNGEPCGSPALNGAPLCYFHARTPPAVANSTELQVQREAPLDLPAFDLSTSDSPAAILAALSQLTLALAANRIDLKRATLLLRALSLATRLSTHAAKTTPKPIIPTKAEAPTVTRHQSPSTPSLAPETWDEHPPLATEPAQKPVILSEAGQSLTVTCAVEGPAVALPTPTTPLPTTLHPNNRLPRSLRDKINHRNQLLRTAS